MQLKFSHLSCHACVFPTLQVKMPDTKEPVRVRVGLHTGDVVTGLIGSKLPKFSVFGM